MLTFPYLEEGGGGAGVSIGWTSRECVARQGGNAPPRLEAERVRVRGHVRHRWEALRVDDGVAVHVVVGVLVGAVRAARLPVVVKPYSLERGESGGGE